MESSPSPEEQTANRFGTQRARLWALCAWVLASCALFAGPLRAVAGFAAENDDASHIFVVPLISVFTIYLERKPIFARLSRGVALPVAFGAFALVLAVATATKGGT